MRRLTSILCLTLICAAVAAQTADACAPTYEQGRGDYYDSCSCLSCCIYVGTTTKKQYWNITWSAPSGAITKYLNNYATTGTGKCFCGQRCDPYFYTPTTGDAGGGSNVGFFEQRVVSKKVTGDGGCDTDVDRFYVENGDCNEPPGTAGGCTPDGGGGGLYAAQLSPDVQPSSADPGSNNCQQPDYSAYPADDGCNVSANYFATAGGCCCQISPVVVDVSGDGVSSTARRREPAMTEIRG